MANIMQIYPSILRRTGKKQKEDNPTNLKNKFPVCMAAKSPFIIKIGMHFKKRKRNRQIKENCLISNSSKEKLAIWKTRKYWATNNNNIKK